MKNKHWYIRYEEMNGKWYYMIYHTAFWGIINMFWERCNTPESAIKRLSELKETIR